MKSFQNNQKTTLLLTIVDLGLDCKVVLENFAGKLVDLTNILILHCLEQLPNASLEIIDTLDAPLLHCLVLVSRFVVVMAFAI